MAESQSDTLSEMSHTACSGICSLAPAGPGTPAPTHVGFAAVTDIEDMRFVRINNIRRGRPPIVPFLCPFRMELEVGKVYRYCACGRSKSQPFCDDEHTDDDPQPIEFSIDAKAKYQKSHLICGCKYTTKPPFCDGSHIHVVDGYEEEEAAVAAAAAATTAAAAAATVSAEASNEVAASATPL